MPLAYIRRKMTEIYVSVDIEADGPIPGPNNMLSLGAAAFDPEGNLIDTFTVNLEDMPDTTMDPRTKEFWDKNPKAYEATRTNQYSPKAGMVKFERWLKNLPSRPVFVGYPAGFDFTFVYWYLIKFVGYSPFSFSALDMKSYAMALMGTEFRKSTKRNMPKRWFSKSPHTHVALDDAIEQGHLFMSMLKERREQDDSSN
jgi:DNA polymerase III alpha subunit (gram-positive type)